MFINTITHRIGRDLVAADGQEISNTRGDVAGTATIVEAKAVKTRKGVVIEKESTREIETETGSVT
jgi:hypothetical protein